MHIYLLSTRALSTTTNRSKTRRRHRHDVNEEDVGGYSDLLPVEVKRAHHVTQKVAVIVPQLTQVLPGKRRRQVRLIGQ